MQENFLLLTIIVIINSLSNKKQNKTKNLLPEIFSLTSMNLLKLNFTLSI